MIRVAVIGAGNWGKNLVRNFYQIPSCELSCCVDPSPERQEFVRQMFPGVKVAGDAEEALQDDTIDAVVIGSPTPTHYPLARAALEAGKHVLVEKPMTQTVAEARSLVELAGKAQRILMVGHLMLYHPAVQRLREYLVDGQLGEIYYLYSQRLNLGTIRSDENALWNFAPHDISIVSYLFEEEPVSVTSLGQCYLKPGVEDVVFVKLRFPDGKMAHLHTSWLDPHKVRRMTLVGSGKMVVFDDMEATEKLKIYDKGVDRVSYDTFGEAVSLRFGDIHIPHVKMVEPLRVECQHFLDCIVDNKTPRSDGMSGLRVVKVLEAAQRSLEQGEVPISLRADEGL